MKNRILSVLVLIFVVTLVPRAEASNERRDIAKIEEMILRDDFYEAKVKCDRFLREYKRSRNKRRVKDLKEIALKKLDEDIDDEKAVSEKPAVRKDVFYIVQVGAFSSYKNAKKVTRSLKKKKFDSIILKVRHGKKVFYRVRAGKFKELKNAEKLVSDLKRRGYDPEIINEE